MPVKKKSAKKPVKAAQRKIKVIVEGIQIVPKKKGKAKPMGCLCEVSGGSKVSYN